MALDLDVKIRSCTVGNVQSQGGAGNENGGWRLDAEEEKEENGRTGMVCTVCTGDNVHHQLTGLDWASGQNPHFNDS